MRGRLGWIGGNDRDHSAVHLGHHDSAAGGWGRLSPILTPRELIDRLAARISPPRRHRSRYTGVLAANAAGRFQSCNAERRIAGSRLPRQVAAASPGARC
ncbi:transposase [Accumulibacter sp.]|uniref:transposase n=1 Tax=Accumulibacter sp. TaxID=2053492 RepID=UPI0038574DB6